MFYHLQYIHLFRPFLRYNPSASPLPPHVSPRRICTANAGFISKLMRLYKKLYNLRQICNIAVYMLHSACTIHLLNLPEKTARRDVIHGVKHLEEIAEDWLCARRTLSILSVLARKWNCELPEEAAAVLRRTDEKYGYLVTTDVPSPSRSVPPQLTPSPPAFPLSPAQPHTAADPSRNINISQTSTAAAAAGGMPQDVSVTSGGGSSVMQTTDFLAGLGSIAPASIQSLGLAPALAPAAPTPTPTSNPEAGAFTPDNSWVLSGISQPAMPRYYQTYAPVQPPPTQQQTQNSQQHRQQQSQHSIGSSSAGTPAGTSRQRTPIPQYALDGKDWYLKDGVSWQQNFEGWGLGASPGHATANGGGGGGGGGGGNMAGGDMFMFKGLQGDPDLSMAEGWDFDSSMTNLDLLPGLD